MAYWLLKTEPEEYSWDDQVKRGARGEAWSGVRNFTARGNLKAMKKGDRAFFYHTGEEKQIVGIVEVMREAYKDPTDPKGVFLMVDVKAACGDQIGTEAEGHGASKVCAALGPAGDRGGVEDRRQDGRAQGVAR